MSESKILTFKEISDALNAGKHVDVDLCNFNPFKLIEGKLADSTNDPGFVCTCLQEAMHGSEKDAERADNFCKEKGIWIRTVKVEV